MNSLLSLDISSFNTSKVKDISGMFYGLSRIRQLSVTNFIRGNVEDFPYLFYYCSWFSTLDISNFDTSKATNMASMFEGVSRVRSLN